MTSPCRTCFTLTAKTAGKRQSKCWRNGFEEKKKVGKQKITLGATASRFWERKTNKKTGMECRGQTTKERERELRQIESVCLRWY